MSVKYLFSSAGEWIAFLIGKNLFDPSCNWIGWLPWQDSDVVSPEGEYLGTITGKDRIYFFYNKPYRGYPGYPGYPGNPGYPGHPGHGGYSPLPSGARDIEIKKK